MPSKQFISAVDLLDPNVANLVTGQLNEWQREPLDSPWPQIARNIENETALKPVQFSRFLSDFAAALASSSASEAWISVCRKNQFTGRKLKSSEIPQVLGRMMKLDEIIKRLIDLGSFPLSIVEALMWDADGVEPSTVYTGLPDLLRLADLGSFVIWATFEEANPDQNPFDSFPDSAVDCCTILGLPDPAGSKWILLHYYSNADQPASGFHRPTVADASDFPLFRPHPKASEIFGRTHPTSPNAKGFSGRPEIVHGKITGKGLIFPYRLVV